MSRLPHRTPQEVSNQLKKNEEEAKIEALIRQKALLEACAAICPECAKGSGLLANETYPNYFHVVGRQGVVDCPATPIRKLL